MGKCGICSNEIKVKGIVLEVREGKDIRICEDCMGGSIGHENSKR